MEHPIKINFTTARCFCLSTLSKRWYVIILFLFQISFSYGQFDTVFKVPKEMQLRVLDSIAFSLVYISKYDSIPIHFEKLKSLALERKDYRFQIISELYRMRYEYKNKIFDSTKESLLFNQLLNIAREHHDTLMIASMANRFGDILRDHSKFAKSISYYLMSYKYLPYLDSRLHKINVTLLELQLASFYYHIEDYDNSIGILSKSIASNSINYSGMGCYDLWSQVCLKLKDYSCSKNMILKAYSIYQVSDTNSWFFNGWAGIFKGNLGKIEFYQQNYKQAIPLFKEGIRITSSALMHDNVASFGILLAQCYIHTQQATKALELLNMIQSSIYQHNDPQLFVDYFKLCLVLGTPGIQTKQRLQYFDSLNLYNIKLQDRENKDDKIKEDLAMEISSQELFQIQMEQKIQRQLKIRNTIVIILIPLSLLVAWVIYRKQNQLAAQKRLTLEIELKAKIDLAAAKEELSQFKAFLLEKNSRILNLERTIQGIETQQEIEELKYLVILTNDDWKKFKTLFERVYPGYLDKLKILYPQLTQGEIRYFLLLKLDLNNKEMAALMGVSSGAMRTIKSRLLKKLNLKDEIEFAQLLE